MVLEISDMVSSNHSFGSYLPLYETQPLHLARQAVQVVNISGLLFWVPYLEAIQIVRGMADVCILFANMFVSGVF